jgi:hypothetical protein
MNGNNRITDFAEILGEMNGGVFLQLAGAQASDIALAVTSLERQKKGKLVLEFTFERIGDSNQINITHTIKSTVPRARGQITEDHTTETPFHVGSGGKITLFPNAQTKLELGAGAATGRTDGGIS